MYRQWMTSNYKGSFTAATVGSAVKAVCDKVRERLFKLARNVEKSPLAGAGLEDVVFSDGRVALSSDASQFVTIADAMRHGGISDIEEETVASPDEQKQSQYARNSHSAVFAEVKVDHARQVAVIICSHREFDPGCMRR